MMVEIYAPTGVYRMKYKCVPVRSSSRRVAKSWTLLGASSLVPNRRLGMQGYEMQPLPRQLDNAIDYSGKYASHICHGGPAGGLGGGSGGDEGRPIETTGQKILLGIALSYMTLIVLLPFGNVFFEVCRNMDAVQ